MKRAAFTLVLFIAAWLAGAVSSLYGQGRSQEVSESDGLPVLVKHLPNWTEVSQRATFLNDMSGLPGIVGKRPILDGIEFPKGTEAVTAEYPEGRLLVIEFMTPQASADADAKAGEWLAANPDSRIEYRRIGNYNAFVFDAPDLSDAKVLLEQVKYEKTVQWLGEDPFFYEKLERSFAITTADIFLSTLKAIAIGMGTAVLAGLLIGFLFFQIREKQRRQIREFSDAGGMVRLNLDGLTPELAADRLLNE
ncbi:MAG: hypothetical protein ACK4S4_01675 [Pyrinomonadaceae bacterium]